MGKGKNNIKDNVTDIVDDAIPDNVQDGLEAHQHSTEGDTSELEGV